MDKYLLKSLTILGIFIILISSCETDNEISISKIELLTNNSDKTWHLSKIISNNLTIDPLPCISDDRHIFQSNGYYLVDNAETIYKIDSLLISPTFCVDTIRMIDTLNWEFNNSMDTLIFSSIDWTSKCKILKIETDSLVIERIYNDTVNQIECFTINY
ncbi:hypothetical protein ACFLS4_01065 [Bacteroidota bacterium]